MRRWIVVALLLSACVGWSEDSLFGFRSEANRSNVVYRVGEEITFTITATNGLGEKVSAGVVEGAMDDWCGHILVRQTIDLSRENPFVMSCRLAQPGFVRCAITGKGAKRFLRGAACEPERLKPAGECPADFDAFWSAAQARLEAEVPLDPRLVLVPERSKGAYDYWKVSFATFGGKRVWGFLSVPKDKSKGPFPVSFEVASAGKGRWTMDMSHGFADRIRMYFTVHCFEPPETVEELQKIRDALSEDLKRQYGVASYSAAGIAVSREEYYFYRVILGINRAVNWLWAREDVDRSRFNYTGGSQGGGFGWYLCGLNPKFTSAVLVVPAISDTMGDIEGRITGFPYYLAMNRSGDRYEQVLRNGPYFNGANFAPRVKCPVRVTIGFIDEICPPIGIYSAYNSLGSADKGIIHGIERGHGYWPEANAAKEWQTKNW